MTRSSDPNLNIAPDIFEHYNAGREVDRLRKGSGLLEDARTREIISRHMPSTAVDVLDVGGGPGAYALWLARLGHRVHLVDATPLHVQQAAEASSQQADAPLASVAVGDARDLQVPDASFDVVLCLGPLYHLMTREDRLSALGEAHRVLRPGGVVICAAICRGASLLSGLAESLLVDPVFRKIVERDLETGEHQNGGNPNYFATAFFHHPDELVEEVGAVGLDPGPVISIEGPCWVLPDFEKHWANDEVREELMGRARQLESDPMYYGVSPHLAIVGRKRGGGGTSG